MRSSCSFNVLRLYVTAHFLAGKKSSNVDRWIPRDEMNGWMNARLTDPPPFSIPSSQRAAYHFLAPDANTRPYCRIYLTQIVSRHCTAYLRPIWRAYYSKPATHSRGKFPTFQYIQTPSKGCARHSYAYVAWIASLQIPVCVLACSNPLSRRAPRLRVYIHTTPHKIALLRHEIKALNIL